MGVPKNLGVRGRHLSRLRRPFWAPLAAILDFAGGAALQAVSECPLRRQAGIFYIFFTTFYFLPKLIFDQEFFLTNLYFQRFSTNTFNQKIIYTKFFLDRSFINQIFNSNENNLIFFVAQCTDENNYCQYWSSIGECQKNPAYMLVKCKKSCKVCTGKKIPNQSFYHEIELTTLKRVSAKQ